MSNKSTDSKSIYINVVIIGACSWGLFLLHPEDGIGWLGGVFFLFASFAAAWLRSFLEVWALQGLLIVGMLWYLPVWGNSDEVAILRSQAAFAMGVNFNLLFLYTTQIALAVKRFTEELDRVTGLDPLTGLLNQKRFMHLLETQNLSQRAESKVSACVFVDCDQFKLVNDTLGHLVGDKYLVAASDSVAECVRQNELAARWGGDEFVLLLFANDQTEIEHRVRQLQQVLEALEINGDESSPNSNSNSDSGISLPKSLTWSIGVSIDQQAKLSAEMVQTADRAMYLAKADAEKRIHTTEAADSSSA